ncbi:unnamed protein product [Malus baccata var. baccata]
MASTLVPIFHPQCCFCRTQCTRLPLYAGSGRGECRLALPPFMERLLPSLEPETYRSWAKALAIAPSATSKLDEKTKKKKKKTNLNWMI